MDKKLSCLGVVLLLALGAVLLCQEVEAQKTKGKTRLAETKYLMRGINLPNCAALGKLLKEAPADDKTWEQVSLHAALLNEASYLLMDDGRCPDKEWATAAKTLRECSGNVLTAAKEKDLATAQTAFKKLTSACASCHAAHKQAN
jgi:hypothetical protein